MASSPPTLPGQTTNGRPGHFTFGLSEGDSSQRQSGTPGAACPATRARFIPRDFLAASEDVIPPWNSSMVYLLLQQQCRKLTFAIMYRGLVFKFVRNETRASATVDPMSRLLASSSPVISSLLVITKTS